MEQSLSLVVPVYNEQENIEPLISELKDFFSSYEGYYEVIFVDDGSTDKSREIISDNMTEYMRLEKHKNNRGYGDALKTGFNESGSDLIAYIDGDGQFKVSDLEKLLEYIGEYDIVIGERNERADSNDRVIISKAFNFIVRNIFDIQFNDIDCGLKVFRREILEEIELSTRRTVDAELIAKSSKRDFEIKQIEVDHYSRDGGKSEADGLIGVRPKLVLITIKEMIEIKGGQRR